MEIEQQIWGATSEGEAVVLYTLRNAAGAEVRLCNVGAAVVSILVPDRDGHLADVALGYKDFRSYFGDPALCGKSIGRVAGCIAYGTMRIDGEEYRLDINGMAGHLNGGVKGFAGRLWESRVETNRVVMSLSSDDGDQGYPDTEQFPGRNQTIVRFQNSRSIEPQLVVEYRPAALAAQIEQQVAGHVHGRRPVGSSDISYFQRIIFVEIETRRFPFTAPLG